MEAVLTNAFLKVVVKGPAVARGEASLGFAGTFRNDSCLAYA